MAKKKSAEEEEGQFRPKKVRKKKKHEKFLQGVR